MALGVRLEDRKHIDERDLLPFGDPFSGEPPCFVGVWEPLGTQTRDGGDALLRGNLLSSAPSDAGLSLEVRESARRCRWLFLCLSGAAKDAGRSNPADINSDICATLVPAMTFTTSSRTMVTCMWTRTVAGRSLSTRWPTRPSRLALRPWTASTA